MGCGSHARNGIFHSTILAFYFGPKNVSSALMSTFWSSITRCFILPTFNMDAKESFAGYISNYHGITISYGILCTTWHRWKALWGLNSTCSGSQLIDKIVQRFQPIVELEIIVPEISGVLALPLMSKSTVTVGEVSDLTATKQTLNRSTNIFRNQSRRVRVHAESPMRGCVAWGILSFGSAHLLLFK